MCHHQPLLAGKYRAATGIWLLGIALWLLLIYTILTFEPFALWTATS
jgi:hypothetical protein